MIVDGLYTRFVLIKVVLIKGLEFSLKSVLAVINDT